MRRLLRRYYGAGPLHLLALIASFALAGYAARELVQNRALEVGVWFVGAAVGHDLVVLPLYALTDRAVARSSRRSAVNYVRIPAALSALLFLVFLPLILRVSPAYERATTLSANRFVQDWLLITGSLFLVSAVLYALRLHRARRPP